MDLNTGVTIDLKPMQIIDYYCDTSSEQICRVCLEKGHTNRNMSNIFASMKQYNFSSMMMACASVQIVEGDGLPDVICDTCAAKLEVAWEFKVQCENSELKLRQLCANQHIQTHTTLENFNIIDNNKHDFAASGEVFETNMHQLLPVEDMQNIEKPQDTIVNKKPLKSREKQVKQKEPKIHQCDTCGKIFNRREYLTQHIRIHTGEKPYKCHLCDRRFVNSGHLTTHMRTHTGERPHTCNICPKAFSTRQELQKHIMVHTGERPYECDMCGKTFGSSSNLYTHLRHHTGQKNFSCESCGKSFYTKQELKQHLVVHTGEKNFICKVCNKRFSQTAHLRRHFKVHKDVL